MPLHIKEPCSANWQDMSPSQQGKFCQECQKEVVDFTNFSTHQIQEFFQKEQGRVCGRFEKGQLDSTFPFPTPSRVKKWAAAAVLTAVVTLSSCGDSSESFVKDLAEPWLWESADALPEGQFIMGMMMAEPGDFNLELPPLEDSVTFDFSGEDELEEE